jgi:hypothetical protein
MGDIDISPCEIIKGRYMVREDARRRAKEISRGEI